MKIPFLSAPDKWEPREHIGLNYKGMSPIVRQLVQFFDVLEQKQELSNRRAIAALLLSVLAIMVAGTVAALFWEPLQPIIKKILE